MNKIVKSILFLIGVAVIVSCGNKQKGLADGASGDMTEYESSDVNAIVQAKPEIMVLPSDKNLKDFGALMVQNVNGQNFTVRDYSKYILADPNFKGVTAYIQGKFIDENFPLNDFEQTLKSLDTQTAEDMADGLAQDAKTQLLATAHPDIILELDYELFSDVTRSSSEKKISYLVNAIDPYTNKVIATVKEEGVTGKDAKSAIEEGMNKNMPKLMGDIQKYFNDILTRGREVTVRINVDAESNQKLTDQSIEGDTYADAIVDYIKAHTVKGAYKMQTNTRDQLTFSNVRIMVLNEDGTQYGVYDWTRDLQKHLKKELGLSSENRSQGLGEIVLTVKGM